MKNILITGANGQLGSEMRLLANADTNNEYIFTDVNQMEGRTTIHLDITNREAVCQMVQAEGIDAIVNCAAWTNVDGAEDNKEACYKVNVEGTKNITDACRNIGAKLIYISTDYVFNGQGEKPWTADCKDYAPLSVYGQSKLDGELAVANTLEKYFIVRTAWVFGINGKNFISK